MNVSCVTSSATVRALSPLPGVDGLVMADVFVRLPDGREEQSLNQVAFVPHVGSPRLVINEVDYDQPSTDTRAASKLSRRGAPPDSGMT